MGSGHGAGRLDEDTGDADILGLSREMRRIREQAGVAPDTLAYVLGISVDRFTLIELGELGAWERWSIEQMLIWCRYFHRDIWNLLKPYASSERPIEADTGLI